MVAGIEIFNDKGSIQITGESFNLFYESKNSMVTNVSSGDIRVKSVNKALGNGVCVYHMPTKTSGNPVEMTNWNGHDWRIGWYESGIVEEYIYTTGIKSPSNLGLQVFNEAGIEVFNIDSKPLRILDYIKYYSNPPTSYTAGWDFTHIYKSYPNVTKLGLIMVKPLIGGCENEIYSAGKMQKIYYALYYEFRMNGGSLQISYKPIDPETESYGSQRLNDIAKINGTAGEIMVVDLSSID